MNRAVLKIAGLNVARGLLLGVHNGISAAMAGVSGAAAVLARELDEAAHRAAPKCTCPECEARRLAQVTAPAPRGAN